MPILGDYAMIPLHGGSLMRFRGLRCVAGQQAARDREIEI